MATVSLLVGVSNRTLEAAERDDQAADLGRTLRELDGTALSTIASAAIPRGGAAMGGDVIGGFSLTIPASRRAVSSALESVRAWTRAVASRSVLVELDGDRLEITAANASHLDHALTAFLDRHCR